MLSSFGGDSGVSLQAATEAKNNIPEFKDALQLIRSVSPEKAINNAVKDFRKRPQSAL